MMWTAALPTAPGFYWRFMIGNTVAPYVCHVGPALARLHEAKSDKATYHEDVRWMGPLPVPEIPTGGAR